VRWRRRRASATGRSSRHWQGKTLSQRIEDQEKRLSQRIEDQEKRLSQQIEDQVGALSQRIEDQGKTLSQRIEDQGKTLSQRIEDQGKTLSQRIEDQRKTFSQRLDDVNKRLDDQHDTMLAFFGAIIALIVALFGYIAWDRRTMMQPMQQRIERLELDLARDLELSHADGSRLTRLVSALRELAWHGGAGERGASLASFVLMSI